MPGETLSHYRILHRLGAGGMGEVYLAQDTRLGRKVALKLLPPAFADSEDRLHRFQQEACTASALNHPNILTIYEVGEAEGRPYIATEFIEGATLRQRMRRGSLAVSEAVEVAAQVASALAAAHAAGIVHRDIKPENIMLRADEYVKVLDFGLAKPTRPQPGPADTEAITRAMVHTQEGVVVGTASYMSPEQARGLPVDGRTDIWSLGAVLYEMLTGRPPFEGPTAMDVIGAVLHKEPSPAAASTPSIPPALDRIVMKALRKERSERYQTAGEMGRDLKAFSQDRRGRTEHLSSASRPGPGNLSAPLTPLVGRREELLALERLLREEPVRLLTLTGPSGTGKTRLALGAALEVADSFEDGAFLVSLASVRDPALVPSTIARTLGLREEGGRPLLDILKLELRDRHLFLLLDNFEQVLPAAPLIAELLMAAPRLKIVATSRAALHVRGEHEFAVSPLAVPRPGASSAEVREAGAVALFLERARAAKPDFALTEDNAAPVAEICRRLDGLPLAIELAAARVKVLPPAALRLRLESRLDLLTHGARDLPPRQQTMRDAIAWSYDILDEAEKAVFRRLSVFVGGWTLEPAAAVCVAGGDPGIDSLEGIASLVDKSLVRQGEGVEGEPRFHMLETIREYALERLAASGEGDLSRTAHAVEFLKLAEEAAPELASPEQAAWLDRLDAEHDNLRAALEWLGQRDPESALRLGAALWRFWERRGHLTEGRARLTALLALRAEPPSKAYTKVLYAAGVLADAQGDYATARSFFEENLASNRQAGDKAGIANSLNNLGIVMLRLQDHPSARALYYESLGLWRELGNPTAVALSLSNLGNVARLQGRHDEARAFYEESLGIFRDLGDDRGRASSLNHLGDIARDQGDRGSARSFYAEGLAVFRRINERRGMASALSDLGSLAAGGGDLETARSLYAESLTIYRMLGDKQGIVRSLEGFVALAAAQQAPERAARLAAAAAVLREELGVPLPPSEEARLGRSLEAARAALGEAGFEAAWSAGRVRPLDEAIADAVGAGPSGLSEGSGNR